MIYFWRIKNSNTHLINFFLLSCIGFILLSVYREEKPNLFKYHQTLLKPNIYEDFAYGVVPTDKRSSESSKYLNLRDFTHNFYDDTVLSALLNEKMLDAYFNNIEVKPGLLTLIKHILVGAFEPNSAENRMTKLKAYLKSRFTFSLENEKLRFTIISANPEFDLALFDLWLVQVFDQYIRKETAEILQQLDYAEQQLSVERTHSVSYLNFYSKNLIELKWDLINIEFLSHLGLGAYVLSKPRLVGKNLGSNMILENLVIIICLAMFFIIYSPFIRMLLKK